MKKIEQKAHIKKTFISSALVLVLTSFAPFINVRAIDNPGNYAQVRMRGASGIAIEGTNITAGYAGGEVSVTGATDPAYEIIQNWDYGGGQTGDMHTLYTKSSSLTFTAHPNENKRAEARIDGQLLNLTNNSYTMEDLLKQSEVEGQYDGYEIEFSFVDENNQGNEGDPQPTGNKMAHLRVKGGDGSFVRSHNTPEGEVSETVYYKDTYSEASFSINGGYIDKPAPEGEVKDGDELLYNQLDYNYNGEDDDGTISLRVSTIWNLKLANKIIINDENEYIISDYINYNNRESWLAHYNHQEVGIDLTVPKAEDDIYNIVVYVEDGVNSYIGNFLWTADPAQEFIKNPDTGEYILDEDGNKIRGYDYIGHSTLALVGASYTVGGIDYSCDEEDFETDSCHVPCLEFDHSDSLEYDDGSLVVPAGARVTMRVIPDRGYQVTNINVAELTTTDDGVGEFTFTVPSGAAYFMADVVEVEDRVDAESEAVESGSIVVGDDEDALDYGTAKLEVKDVELDDEDIDGFEGAADGYDISTYLDISLYKTLYKGTETDTWDEQIDELDGEATITLKLEEGVDGNEVVIVHQKHDGTYEVIPTTYDSVTHTITFKTLSFSNYAIASSNSLAIPDTGHITVSEVSSTTAVAAGATIASIIIFSFGITKCMVLYKHKRNR